MKYLLFVFFLLDGQWVQGDPDYGWGPVPFETEQFCLAAKARGEEINANLRAGNPKAVEAKYECAPQIEE